MLFSPYRSLRDTHLYIPFSVPRGPCVDSKVDPLPPWLSCLARDLSYKRSPLVYTVSVSWLPDMPGCVQSVFFVFYLLIRNTFVLFSLGWIECPFYWSSFLDCLVSLLVRECAVQCEVLCLMELRL